MAIAYKSAGAGTASETSGVSLSPACPATVDAGDILIAHIYWEDLVSAPSTPSGWELLHGPEVIQSTIARHWVFGRVADGSEDGAAVTFATTPAVTTQRGARIYSFSGRVSGTILQLVDGFSATSHATDPQMPTVTTTIAGALAVGLVGQNDNNALASATGESGGDWTQPVTHFAPALTPGLAMGLQVATPTADPGTISGGSISTANDPCGVIGFQIKPAPIFIATASLSVGPATLSGTAEFDAPVYSGIGTFIVGSATLSGRMGYASTYRREIVIDNSGGGALTNYQLRVVLTTSNFTFANAQPDGRDIRFYSNEAQSVVLDYWIETWNSTYAVVFVEVPSIPAADTTSIWMFYGDSVVTDEMDFTTVFSLGSDFAVGLNGMTSITSGAGIATVVPKATDLSSQRYRRIWKRSNASVVGIPFGYTYTRDCCILRDLDNRAVREDGSMIMFFSAWTNTDVADVFRVTSEDGDAWGSPTKVIDHTDGNPWHAGVAGSPTVLKFGPSDYRMWYQVRTGAGAEYKIAKATSSDGVTWTPADVILTKDDFSNPVPFACAVPFITPLSDGTFVLLVEAYTTGPNVFRVHGWSSPDAADGNWTALNGGEPLITPGTAGQWDDVHAANPKLIELPDETYLIEYNGGEDAVNADFRIGFATATDLDGPWTKETAINPVIGNLAGRYGTETSSLSYNEDGTSFLHYHQDFTGGYQTALIWKSEPITEKGLFLRAGEVIADAAALTVVGNTGSWILESVSYMTADRNTVADLFLLGVWDHTGTIAVDSSTNHLAKRRVEIGRATSANAVASAGDLILIYQDTSNAFQIWNGSAWSTSVVRIASDHKRPVLARITDDGTNYVLRAEYADDGTLIATASIAKTSVKAVSNSRVLVFGDPFNNTWAGGLFLRSILQRQYVSVEPEVTLGEELGGIDISPLRAAIGRIIRSRKRRLLLAR